MGMYTEIIFGASLKTDTPEEVINILKFLCRELKDLPPEPEHDFFKCERWQHIFTMSSYYFGMSRSHSKIVYDKISDEWIVSARANLKNYDDEIEKFCDWIKPYIEGGSGETDIFCIEIFEQAETPKLYQLEE